MTLSRSAVCCVVFVSFAGCMRPVTPATEAPSGPTSRLGSPISVTWEQLELSTTRLRARAHIKRLAAMGPLAVRIEVPSMARMTIGRTLIDVPANSAADEITESIELTYGQVPVQDLVLHVSGGGQAGGVSYAVPYRFGRVLPVESRPTADGPKVIINGRNLGPSIPLEKK